MSLSVNDSISFANSEDYVTENIHFDWHVDFNKEIISGSETLKFLNVSKKKADLKLDSKYLDIKEVSVNQLKVDHRLEPSKIEALGSCLIIPIKITDTNFTVTIKYSTTKKCTALQWLSSNLTSGKKYPYLYSQCQAIHARSLFPCQDTPSVKSTYTATVTARKELKVLMSAIENGSPSPHEDVLIHKFEQKVKIPSYLVAIVCGDLKSRELSKRVKVWSEAEMVEQAAEEFSATENFLSIAESLCGQYVWGRYDILVLPHSFPYGGMENPCLTFVTPTLVVHDKSLAYVIAHEISHSWTGNLVTNKTWDDFWLNEGHTRYVERLIMEKYHKDSEPMRHLLIKTGLAELQESLNGYGKDHEFNQLVPRLVECDPDDAFSRVPYEKGSNLLFFLENKCGKDKMLRWLKAYVEEFKYKSLTTTEWKAFFFKYMIEKEHVSKSDLESVDWNAWFTGRWKIPVRHNLNEQLVEMSNSLIDKWINSTNISVDRNELQSKYLNLSSEQKYCFFQYMNDMREAILSHEKLDLMKEIYGIQKTKNWEILFGWYMLSIRSKYKQELNSIFEFLESQGRLKYTKPLYRALYSWPDNDVKQRTVTFFNKVKLNMHPITRNVAAKMLSLKE